MKEFDLIDLTNLYFSGYRFVLVQNRRDHSVLKPLTREAPKALIDKMGFYQLPILEPEIIEMASGQSAFPVYLPEEFFEENYREYVLS